MRRLPSRRLPKSLCQNACDSLLFALPSYIFICDDAMAIISAPITLLLLAAAGPIEMPPPSKSATALAIFFAVISVVTGTITTHNGGYKGVVVSISPEVPENAQLFFNITKWIRSGSE